MARKKKKKARGAGEQGSLADDSSAENAPPQKPVHIGTSLQSALAGVRVAKKRRERPGPTGSGGPKGGPSRVQRPKPTSDSSVGDRAAKASPDSHSYEDRVARRQAMAGVEPLRRKRSQLGSSPVPPSSPRPSPQTATAKGEADAEHRFRALTSRGSRFVLTEEPDWIEGHREGAGSKVLRDLKGGRARAEAELDLHGKREAEAVTELVAFLRTERNRGGRVVRIIHGKGLHSPGAPVLRDAVVAAIVRGPANMLVVALSTCAQEFGGSGAMLLRLDSR